MGYFVAFAEDDLRSVRSPSPTEITQVRFDLALRMVAMWARASQVDARRYREAAAHAHRLDKIISYGDVWPLPIEDLAPAVQEVWICGYRLVMSAFQMERWKFIHQQTLGVAESPNEPLRNLRNALEHLDEAQFSEFFAYRDPDGPKRQSIGHLPGQSIFLGFHASYIDLLFGLVEVDSLVEDANRFSDLDQPEEPDYSDYDW